MFLNQNVVLAHRLNCCGIGKRCLMWVNELREKQKEVSNSGLKGEIL